MVTKRHLAGQDYNVVIVYWKMPGMDGIETIRRLREEVETHIPILLIRSLPSAWASSIPIVAMTADDFSENVTECLNTGMNGISPDRWIGSWASRRSEE